MRIAEVKDRKPDFMNIWAFEFTKEQTLMNKEIPTLFYI